LLIPTDFARQSRLQNEPSLAQDSISLSVRYGSPAASASQ
jgi:hypothetical protein